MSGFRPTLEQIALAAAAAGRWWADQLRMAAGVTDGAALPDPTGLVREGVEGVQKAAMLDYICTQLRAESGTTAAHCDTFEDLLQTAIGAHLASDRNHWRDCHGWDDGGPEMLLCVDYQPDQTLLTALRAADVERNMAEAVGLPLKTDMLVSARRVEVSHGYGAPWTCIYGPLWGSTRAEYQHHDEKLYQAQVWYATWLRTLMPEDRDLVDPVLGPQRPRWQGPV